LIPLIDNHGHSLLANFREAKERDFVSTFSESKFASLMTRDIESSLVFLEMKKRLFDLSDAKTIAQYLTLRSGNTAFARHLVKDLFAKAGFERIVLDDGFASSKMMLFDQFEALTGVKVSRVVRVEPVFERLLTEYTNATELERHLELSILPALDTTIVGLKTIVCYRGGLSLHEVDPDDAAANFEECRRNVLATGRIKKSSYYYHLLLKTFDLAIERDLPVQVHCGLGDDDADLTLSNPELLHRLLRKPRFNTLKLVLLHCYPFQKEAAILSSLYPGVYFDLSLAAFLLADQSDLYRGALASAPYTKILAGTDGHSQPETYYQGALALRNGLSSALLAFEQKGSISREEAGEIENAILHGNARKLYKLGKK
jgi:hypothetical protein